MNLVSLAKLEGSMHKLKEESLKFRQKYNVQLTESLINCFPKQDISSIQMVIPNLNEETIDEIMLALEPESLLNPETDSKSNQI